MKSEIVDSFGRLHTNLRISVTDRCNIRCFYCMPLDDVQFLPRDSLLTFDEIARFANIAARMGVTKIRLTGGEPLVRRDLPTLVSMLSEINGIHEIALTTNGILLDQHATALRDAGLDRINVSLDAVDAEVFKQIARRDGLEKVLSGIQAAKQAGFEHIKINAVAIKSVNEDQILPLAKFCRDEKLDLRFIEFMPLDAEANWLDANVLTGEYIRNLISAAVGELVPIKRNDPNQPATAFQYAEGTERVGFINSVSAPFCSTCNRLRISSEGKLQNCLFADDRWDVREMLRGGVSDEDIAELVQQCVDDKKAGHGSNDLSFVRPQKAMYQIGG